MARKREDCSDISRRLTSCFGLDNYIFVRYDLVNTGNELVMQWAEMGAKARLIGCIGIALPFSSCSSGRAFDVFRIRILFSLVLKTELPDWTDE
jgi:hypothetical protein